MQFAVQPRRGMLPSPSGEQTCPDPIYYVHPCAMQILKGVPAGPASDNPGWVEEMLELMRIDGRPVMLLVVALVLYPLCLQRHIRQVRGTEYLTSGPFLLDWLVHESAVHLFCYIY